MENQDLGFCSNFNLFILNQEVNNYKAKGEIKVSKNIEINYLNESNEYETLYPVTLASEVLAGTFPGQVLANSTAEGIIANTQIRNIYCGTVDMTAGSSVLTTGEIYLVYE